MDKQREEALICMFLAPAIVFVTGSASVSIIYTHGMNWVGIFLFVLVGFLLFGAFVWPFISYRIQGSTKVSVDERDLCIMKNSLIASHIASFFYFFIISLIAWWKVGADGVVTVNLIPLIFIGWLSLFIFVQSLSSFIQGGVKDYHAE